MQNGVHYFYWDWDFYKPFDYEPTSIYSYTAGKTILSRFHWHVLTIWTEPVDDEGKPSVEFTKLVHTPIVKSESYDDRYLEIEPLTYKERVEMVFLYTSLFRRALNSAKFKRKRKNYDNIMQNGGVPNKYLFKLSDVKGAVVIGSSLPKPNELPITLRDKIW